MSDHSSGDGGRPLPMLVADFGKNCVLRPAEMLLIAKINCAVTASWKSYIGLSRHLAKQGRGSIPRWAQLDEEGKNQTSSAKNYQTRFFGAGAKLLPLWAEINAILVPCKVDEFGVLEIAALWAAVKGERPDGVEGELPDVSGQIRDAEETVKRMEAGRKFVDEPTDSESIEESVEHDLGVRGDLQALRHEVERMRAKDAAQQQYIGQLEASYRMTMHALARQAFHRETELRNLGIPVLAPVVTMNPWSVINRNEEMLNRLIAGNAAISADKIRTLTRARECEQRMASDWHVKLAREHQGRVSSYHLAARLLTHFVGPATLSDRARARQLSKLSLPGQVARLFESSGLPALDQQNLVDRSLTFYLRMYLILDHSGRQENLSRDFVRLLQDGVLPSETAFSGLFETKEDVDQLNALLALIENGQGGVQKISFDGQSEPTAIMRRPCSFSA